MACYYHLGISTKDIHHLPSALFLHLCLLDQHHLETPALSAITTRATLVCQEAPLALLGPWSHGKETSPHDLEHFSP